MCCKVGAFGLRIVMFLYGLRSSRTIQSALWQCHWGIRAGMVSPRAHCTWHLFTVCLCTRAACANRRHCTPPRRKMLAKWYCFYSCLARVIESESKFSLKVKHGSRPSSQPNEKRRHWHVDSNKSLIMRPQSGKVGGWHFCGMSVDHRVCNK